MAPDPAKIASRNKAQHLNKSKRFRLYRQKHGVDRNGNPVSKQSSPGKGEVISKDDSTLDELDKHKKRGTFDSKKQATINDLVGNMMK